ncbi:YqiA/YcfP family alpha/beta fold hydrolase [Advenella sp. RU8]|uniref:YqiA/YcfP family alpha/beta fold hydrolase n=1 Tax=Advenella sp. RU8 TaxID=3399575 RepID=UPI003AAAE2FA
MILYLHGFRSSSLSAKSQLMQQAMASRGLSHAFAGPDLPVSPKQAIELALATARQLSEGQDIHQLTVIGSSLGGYYATWLANELDCKAVLVNPCIYASRDLSTQLGPMTCFHSDEPFELKAAHIRELANLFVPEIRHPEKFFLLARMADEVLDWQEMQNRYLGAKQLIIPGGDHGFSDFEKYIPQVLDFALNN